MKRNLGRSKPIITIAALTLSVSALAGCGSTSNESSNTGACDTKDSKLKLAFIYASTSVNPFQEMAKGAQAAADADGNVELTLQAPPQMGQDADQVAMLQSASRTATDGIAYQTVNPPVFASALKKASKAGVPLVAVDAGPPVPEVKTFVGNSNTQLGAMLAKAYLAQKPPAEGTIVLGNDIPSLPLLQQRVQGELKVLKKALPKAKIIGPLDSGNERNVNYTKWNGIVKSNPDAVAFLSIGSEGGVNLPLIKKRTGRKFFAGSADLPPEALKAVKAGSLFALASPEHWMKGYMAMQMLIDAKRSCEKLAEGWWDSGNLLITKKNVDTVIARQVDDASRTEWFQTEIKKQLADPPLKPLTSAN